MDGCHRKVTTESEIVSAIRSLVNSTVLQLECTKVLFETLLISVLLYCSDNNVEVEGNV